MTRTYHADVPTVSQVVGLLRAATRYAHKAANAERGIADVREHLNAARDFGMAADYLQRALNDAEGRATHLTVMAVAAFQKWGSPSPGTDAEGTALRRVVDTLIWSFSPAEMESLKAVK